MSDSSQATPVDIAVKAMREYAEWKGKRDEIIRQGLAAGMPVWRIANEMKIDRKIVSKIKRGDHEHAQSTRP